MTFPSPLVVACLSIALAGCAGSRASGNTDPGRRTDQNALLGDEIAKTNRSTLYDAIRQLRPEWIMRSQAGPVARPDQQLAVYVDGTFYGGIESLRQIPPAAVAYARFYSPTAAAAQFGHEHPLGAIEVKTVPH